MEDEKEQQELIEYVKLQIKVLIILGGLPWLAALLALIIGLIFFNNSPEDATALIITMIASGAFLSVHILNFKIINQLYQFISTKSKK